MSELRWHPLLREWVITATERQDRTFLPPKDYCTLCPSRAGAHPTEIPESSYRGVSLLSRFPSLRIDPPVPAVESSALYPVAPASGVCEVVVYTPEHESTLADRTVDEIEELLYVWRDRYRELCHLEEVRYVYIFENKGEAIGVTLHHPHGQIYAFPFVPPRLERELEWQVEQRETTGRCLGCDVVGGDTSDRRRLVLRGSHFYAGVPFSARSPYEVHPWPVRHRSCLTELSAEELRD